LVLVGWLQVLLQHSSDPFPVGNDPTEILWLANRAAYDALCPPGAMCVEMDARHYCERNITFGHKNDTACHRPKEGQCGHTWAGLLVFDAQERGVQVFITKEEAFTVGR
jgi:hypothetical protein